MTEKINIKESKEYKKLYDGLKSDNERVKTM